MVLLAVLLTGMTFYAFDAFAYIDPGTGSAIVSAIVGASVAIGVVVRTYWYKLKIFLSGKKEEEKDADTE